MNLIRGKIHDVSRSTPRLTTPIQIPEGVRIIVDKFAISDGPHTGLTTLIGGDPGAAITHAFESLLGGSGPTVPPPSAKPEPAQEKPRPTRINVGGIVQMANLISRLTPAYPVLAKQAHVQGTVVLWAIISPEGTVEELKVISGHPLLIPAALESVKKWRYRPTLLNGNPVRVETTIKVVFNLGIA